MRRPLVTLLVMLAAAPIASAEPTTNADPPLIAPRDVVATIVAALATPAPRTPRGASRVIATISKADVAVDGKAIRAALDKLGITILDDFMSGDSRVITVEGTSGARATLTLDPTRGAIGIVARPSRTKAPGPCVAVPSVTHDVLVNTSGIDSDGERFEGQSPWKLETVRTFDVDGDGIIDAFVPSPPDRNACPDDVSWRVFVMRGTCGHDLGVVGPGWLAPDSLDARLDASGFRPLVLTSKSTAHGTGPIPELRQTTTSFAIRGARYVKTGATSTSGLCHHCGHTSCAPIAP